MKRTSSDMSSSSDSTLPEVPHAYTTRDDVDEQLRSGLRNSVHMNTSDFLDAICPVRPELVQAIYNVLGANPGSIQAGQEGKLVQIPVPDSLPEDALCNAFVAIANGIIELLHQHSTWLQPEENETLATTGGRWVSNTTHSHENIDSAATAVKPDFYFVHHGADVVTLAPGKNTQNSANEGASMVSSMKRPDIMGHTIEPPTSMLATIDVSKQVGPKKSKKKRRVKWTHMLLVGEVKKVANPLIAVPQILRYCRQIFQNCLDRRFVMGITLTGQTVTVYHADRSGVLASEKIDIVKNWRSFIQLIIGFALLSPEARGYDPTVRVLLTENLTGEAAPSYTFGPETNLSLRSRDFHWEVTMPKPKSDGSLEMDGKKTESFVLYREKSLHRSEAIRGRATRVWEAWKKSSMHLELEDRDLYILKDSWPDARRTLEGDFYKVIGKNPGIAELYSYGKVQIGGVDDSIERIRRGLKPSQGPLSFEDDRKPVLGRRKRKTPKNSRAGSEATVQSTSTNTTVTTSDDTQSGTLDSEASNTTPPTNVSTQNRFHARHVIKTTGTPVREAVTRRQVVLAFRDAIIGHKAAYDAGVLHRDISPENILIVHGTDEGVLIDFDNAIFLENHAHLVDDEISGTIPFMSAEILGKEPIFLDSQSPVVHQGVEHDLEALFWSFTWFVLSRHKAGELRQELSSGQPNQFATYFMVLFSRCNAMSSADKKQNLFLSAAKFRWHIVRPLLNWSRPFEPLLNDFYTTLRLAFETRDFNNIHQRLIDMFTKAAEQLPPENDSDEEEQKGLALQQDRPSTPPQVLSTVNESSQPATSAFNDSPSSMTSRTARGYSTASPANSPEAKRRRYGSFTSEGDESE